MKPEIIIMGVGKRTRVFLDGREIGGGVSNLIYSARNSQGEFSPTLKLLEVDLQQFTWEGMTFEETLAALGVNVQNIPASSEGKSDETGNAAIEEINRRTSETKFSPILS